MAETIVNLVVGKLADAVVNEVLHLYSVNEQVEKISRELTRIQAFLKDADRKQIKDERQKSWVKEIRDIAHSIEDAIDTFLMNIPQNPQKSAIKYMLRNPKNLLAVHNLVNEINQILKKMNEIEESCVRYEINNLGEDSTRDLPVRPTISPDIDPDIVGFKADQDRIVKELLDETTKRRSVVSIYGTGGLGKTTLAQKVYNCNDVKVRFDVCIWVAISEKFEIIDVSRKIMQQVDPFIKLSDLPNKTHVILTMIHNSLRERKYLIVLDDVWTIDLWTQIGVVFPDENNGSRVLVTTRFTDVPKGMDSISEPHKLQFLTEELSRELLLKKVFYNQDPNKSSFDDLSDVLGQFVHKCGGLPLALVVLGGLLLKKPPSSAAWSSVFRTMSWHVICSEIIGTSYEDLPFALKKCFMYFAAFPEDYTIDAPSLLRMWIAEGFIPQENNLNRTLEETAESFLEDLVRRSMVEVEKRSFDGSIKTLRMHNLLRDLALQRAEEENFLLVYSNPEDKMSLSRARRVAIHNPDCDNLILSPNLRTLLCFYNGSIPNCSKQRLLKVVSIGDEDEDNNTIELGMFVELTQLRYLSLYGRLSDNRDQEFFEEVIGRMKFLQTLHIPWLSNFEFPRSAWNIKTLRHLCDDTDTIELPASAKLTNLQTISMVRATQSWEIELPYIPNLRSLELLAISPSSKAVVTFLSKLEHLTNLCITHSHSVLDIFDDMRGFPFYNHLQSLKLHYLSPTKLTLLFHEDMFPCRLISLSIKGYKFQQDIMPVLEKLRCLKALILNKVSQSRKVSCSSRGFSQLEVLKMSWLSMEEWEIEEGAMPILKELKIDECEELGVPQGLQYLTNLQKLEWRDVGNSKANLVRNLCQHVPSIDLGTINVPVNCEETVHLRPLPPNHARVMVDEVVPGEEDTPLPVPNDDMPTIISSVGSSTAWPIEMISIVDQEPRKVHTGGDVVQTGADMFDGIDFGSFLQTYTLLHDRFLNQPNNAFHVNPPPDLFHSKDPLVVHADNFLALVKRKELLTAPIIQIFMMYVQKYNKEEHREDERVGFMDPMKTNFLLLDGDAQSKQYVEAYIKEALRRNRDKKLIFIPYHEKEHWLLVVLMPRESEVYVFNSFNVHCSGKTIGKKSVPNHPKIIDALKIPYQLDQMIEGFGKCPNLKITYCRCPQQTGSWECGYYVMMIVHDIINHFLRDFPKLKDFPTRYPDYKMDEIRNLWCNFFLNEVLIQKSKII